MIKKEFDAEQAFNEMFNYIHNIDKIVNDLGQEIGVIEVRLDRIERKLNKSVGHHKAILRRIDEDDDHDPCHRQS